MSTPWARTTKTICISKLDTATPIAPVLSTNNVKNNKERFKTAHIKESFKKYLSKLKGSNANVNIKYDRGKSNRIGLIIFVSKIEL